MANPTASAALEARRTKMRPGQGVQELDGPPVDTRGGASNRESPHAAACRIIDAARRDNDASDPMPSHAPVSGPAVCTACHKVKAPIGRDVTPIQAVDLCTDECYAYRWSPTPPHDWTK